MQGNAGRGKTNRTHPAWKRKRLNPFLQWDNNTIAQAALNYGKEAGLTVDPENPDQVFAAIRHWKDNF